MSWRSEINILFTLCHSFNLYLEQKLHKDNYSNITINHDNTIKVILLYGFINLYIFGIRVLVKSIKLNQIFVQEIIK